MGNKSGKGYSGDLKSPKDSFSQEFLPCFKKCQSDQNYLNTLIVECPIFVSNLIKIFPDYRSSYQHFFQMIQYFLKYEFPLKCYLEANDNMNETTLIDRFFMTCLYIKNWKEYEIKKCNVKEIEELLCFYMSLFLKDVKQFSIRKILTYINLNKEEIGVKQFATNFRENFPHVQKYLKDYIILKFRDQVHEGYLLGNVKSTIIRQDGIFLALKIPQLASRQSSLLYSSVNGGLSFHSIQKKLIGYTGPWLLIVQHVEKDQNGNKVRYVFGSYQNGPIKDVHTIQGDLNGFLFTIQPNIRFMTTDKGEGGHQYFFINNIPFQVSKMRKGYGFGGDQDKKNMKLWIDQDLDKSRVYNGNDKTYGFGKLAGTGTSTLNITCLEIFGLGGIESLKEQEMYWRQREQEIMKRRKVNKKQLMDSNAGFLFEKTFAHRDQVYGEIQKKQKKEQQQQ